MTAPISPPAATVDIRRQLDDRYTIERELGRGGMGAVYLARDLALDRQVALKVLPPEFAADPALRERFLRETRTAASFSHPNIVPVHAVEEGDGVLAFAMGYVEGESLAERVRRSGPQSAREIVRILQDVGYALAYAHGRGVVHRDIKPDNIMIERATGRALLMDFGISRPIAAPVNGQGLTRVGEVVGTPEYMSPEQASGDAVDGRSDLYSLGLVAWYAATGEVAMSGESTQKVLVRQLTEPVPSLAARRGDLPAPLVEAVARCVAKEPGDRFPNAESLVEAIDAARLSAPEVPLPVRLFANELDTIALLTLFFGIASWTFVSRAISRGVDDLDALIPVVVLVSVLVGRYMQTFWDARRLALLGFPPDEISAGLCRIHDERAEVRAQLKADPEMRRRRAVTVRWAVFMVVGAIVLFLGAARQRVPNGMGGSQFGIPGMFMLVSAMVMFGLGMVLLVKSPLRAPPSERWQRRLWSGPFGRAFLRAAARREAGAMSTTTLMRSGGSLARVTPVLAAITPAGASAPVVSSPLEPRPQSPRATSTPVTPAHSAARGDGDDAGVRSADRLAELEKRLSALERWRDEFTP